MCTDDRVGGRIYVLVTPGFEVEIVSLQRGVCFNLPYNIMQNVASSVSESAVTAEYLHK
jgi:hypothetical protein